MSWDVHFINGHEHRVFVAIKFYQPDPCSQYGRPWGTRGWWAIDPGQSKYVLDTNNRYFYRYAECGTCGKVWTGDSLAPVRQQAFDSCVSIGFFRRMGRLHGREGSRNQQPVALGVAAFMTTVIFAIMPAWALTARQLFSNFKAKGWKVALEAPPLRNGRTI